MSFSETVWCTYIYINIYIYIIWSHVATLGTLMNQTAVKRCPLEKPPTCLRLWIACIRIIGSIRCLKQSRDWQLFHCYTAIPYKIGKLATLKKITLGEDVPFHHVFFSWQLSQPAMTVMTGSIMSLLAWSESHFTKKKRCYLVQGGKTMQNLSCSR